MTSSSSDAGAVTRASSRFEFPKPEFNGTGAISSYIDSESIRIGCCKPIARDRTARFLTKRDRFALSPRGLQPIDTGKTTMFSFKALAAAVLLSATAATPVFAQAPVSAQYSKNLRDSGYNPKNDYNPNGTMRAAIQEPGLFAFYYPNLDVLNGGAPTPAAKMSPDWPALKGACAAIGGGVTYCGDRHGRR